MHLGDLCSAVEPTGVGDKGCQQGFVPYVYLYAGQALKKVARPTQSGTEEMSGKLEMIWFSKISTVVSMNHGRI